MPKEHIDNTEFTECTDSAALTLCLWSLISAAFAFLIVQGRYIGVQNFFSPMHHDDLSALSSDPRFHFWIPRPVSSNFIYMLGSHGAGVYYCIYFALWMFCSVATQLLACRLLNVRLNLTRAIVFTLLSTFAWFSLGSSVMTMQYLGLSTNGLSYLFGVCAVLLLLRGEFGIGRSTVVGALILLSAFAKEDMLAFLGGVLVWRAFDDRARNGVWAPALRQFGSLLALVVVAYGLSLWHSKVSGSPFTGGSGAYDLSSPLTNIVHNAKAFYDSTPGTRTTITLGLSVVALMLIRLGFKQTWRAAADLIAVTLPFALALPYLALPRFVIYYVVTFLPLSIALLPLALRSLIGRPTVAVAMIAAALLAAGLNIQDNTDRAAQLEWNAKARTISRHQIQELARAQDLGISQCQAVAVTGVSAYLGPFLAGNSAFIDKELGTLLQWRIATVPGTIVDTFAKGTPIADSRWVYVPSEEEARKGAHCLLAFDGQGYARFSLLPK